MDRQTSSIHKLELLCNPTRKLCISCILCLKRGKTPSIIDANWAHSNFTCKSLIKSYKKFQLNMSRHVGEKCRKLCISSILNSKQDVFVKHRCPQQQQSGNMAKISKSYILTPPHPQGHVMSVKCEEPIDELTVQVWLLYHHPNFKYCTLFVSRTELWTDKQTIRLLDAPDGPFRSGA